MSIIDDYAALKKRGAAMAAYVAEVRDEHPERQDYKKVHCDLSNCATYLVFHQYYTLDIDQLRLAKAYTCKKHLLCPFCARRRAGKAVAKNEPKLKRVMAENKRLKAVMITLTVKNGYDLRDRHDHMEKALKRLVERRRDYAKKKGVVKRSFVRSRALFIPRNSQTGGRAGTHTFT